MSNSLYAQHTREYFNRETLVLEKIGKGILADGSEERFTKVVSLISR